jgi:hypothetical protein
LHGPRRTVNISDLILALVCIMPEFQAPLAPNHAWLVFLLLQHCLFHVLIEKWLGFNVVVLVHHTQLFKKNINRLLF